MNWLILSFCTLIGWGLWGVFIKIASKTLEWYQTFILGTGVSIIFSIILYSTYKPDINIVNKGSLFAILSTIVSSIAFITFYLAMQKKSASIIVPLTSLYPAVTVILSFLFLKEKITLSQFIGIIFAIIAVVLISKE